MPSEPLFRRHLFSLAHSHRQIAVPYYTACHNSSIFVKTSL
ncbi:hypothetical protein NEIPOLOT_02373 [Neisseria polysaccharea ATCC 43768]|nr:hypothetical protein NEIPOLOT_02373 [Neisseria polysaccharea ATCC 43768]